MPITVSMTFDDAWAARFQPLIEGIADRYKEHPLVISLLEANSITFDELTTVQKFKISVIVGFLLHQLVRYEGEIAAADARSSIVQDVSDNFPLAGV